MRKNDKKSKQNILGAIILSAVMLTSAFSVALLSNNTVLADFETQDDPNMDVLHVFEPTVNNLNGVDFTSDATYVAWAGSAGDGIHTAWTANWTVKQILNNTENGVVVDISPNDLWMAVDVDNTILIYDLKGENDWTLNVTIDDYSGSDYPDTLKFSDDSYYLALGCQDQKIHVYWTSNWTLAWSSAALGDTVASIDWSDEYLAAGNKDGDVNVFWIGNWTVKTALTEPDDRVYALAFSPDNNYLVAGVHSNTGTGEGFLYWTSNWTKKGVDLATDGESCRSASFSQTNNFVSLGTTGDVIYTYYVSNNTLYKITTTNITGDVNYLSYSHDSSGSFLGAACGGGACVIYNATEGEEPVISTYEIKGLSSNKITFAGTAGTYPYCNSTGDYNEWLEINMSINATQNVTDINVSVGDLNDTDAYINASNITMYVSSDNSSYGELGTFIDGGSNLTINITTWNAGTMGSNPFTGAGLTNITTSIYLIFRLSIPADSPTDLFYSLASDSFKIYIINNT